MAEANRSLNLTVSFPHLSQACLDPFLEPTVVKVIKTIAYSVLMSVALVGNSLVIAVIRRNRKLQTTVNFFILNMAVSDLLMPLFAHTMRIKQIYLQRGVWPVGGVFGSTTCKLRSFADGLSIAVSVLTLEVIAVERFFSAVYPMKRQPIRSRKTCFTLIALIWIMGAVFPCIHFYKSKIIHLDTITYCIWSWEPAFDNAEAIKIEFPVFLVCFTMLPFLLLTSLYSAIVISLHRQKSQLHLAPEERQRRARENRQVTYMLVTVVFLFFVAWAPLNVFGFLSAFRWHSHLRCASRHLMFSTVFLAYSPPAINPLIYFIFNENYREGFHKLLCCRTRCIRCWKKHKPREIQGFDLNFATESGSPAAVVALSMRSLGSEIIQ